MRHAPGKKEYPQWGLKAKRDNQPSLDQHAMVNPQKENFHRQIFFWILQPPLFFDFRQLIQTDHRLIRKGIKKATGKSNM